MRSFKKMVSDYFNPESFNDLNVGDLGSALNDTSVRAIWLEGCLMELKRINLEVDKRLLSDGMYGISDLCARRKAYQDVLESILSARRQVTQGVRHNPKVQVAVNLDRVTA